MRALLEDAGRSVDALDDALRARLHARLAADILAANDMGQIGRAIALSNDAAEAARRAGDYGALAQAQMVGLYAAALGMVSPGSGHEASVPSPHEILEAAERGGALEVVMQIRHTRAVFMFGVGNAEAFGAESDALAAVASSSSVPEALWLANALPVHVSQQIMWHALKGSLVDLLPVIDDFVVGHPGAVAWGPIRALARLEAGDHLAARAEFEGFVANDLAAAEAASTTKVTFSHVVVNDQTITATMTVAADAPKVALNVAVANPGGAWQPAAGAAAQCIGCLILR